MLIGLCDRTERPFQNQNKGIFRPDKKAAYLQGLVDGLGIDDTTKEGKIIKAMSTLHGDPLHDDGYAAVLSACHV